MGARRVPAWEGATTHGCAVRHLSQPGSAGAATRSRLSRAGTGQGRTPNEAKSWGEQDPAGMLPLVTRRAGQPPEVRHRPRRGSVGRRQAEWRGVLSPGCPFVRPDRHVAQRSETR